MTVRPYVQLLSYSAAGTWVPVTYLASNLHSVPGGCMHTRVSSGPECVCSCLSVLQQSSAKLKEHTTGFVQYVQACVHLPILQCGFRYLEHAQCGAIVS